MKIKITEGVNLIASKETCDKIKEAIDLYNYEQSLVVPEYEVFDYINKLMGIN